MDEEIKAKIEAILFCLPQGINSQVLAKKLNFGSTGKVRSAISEMQREYEERKSGLMIVEENSLWKFKVPDDYIDLIKEAAEPEFEKAVLETLAYIAYRRGSRQCDVVHVRGNKAYEHIKLLREKGFIEAHKAGLSKWLELTKKFYEYFQLKPGQKLPMPEELEKDVQAADAEKAAEQAPETLPEEKED